MLIEPVILYVLLALGGVGVFIALPRKGANPQPLGALLAAAAGGGVLLALLVAARPAMPNLAFYVFSILALGSGLRVITHPKPVYAALYFILTVLSSAGLYLLLSAEFMAFALIIVYAGAILITYLFVIMLATQSPEEGRVDVLEDYDTVAREPLGATAAGFLLLGVLTTMFFTGATSLPQPAPGDADALLGELPGKVEKSLRHARVPAGSHDWLEPDERLLSVDAAGRTAEVAAGAGMPRTVRLPDDLHVTNTEALGFSLLVDHPGSIEIAGIVLLMAMLGAVVLSRRRVQSEEEEKADAAARKGARP